MAPRRGVIHKHRRQEASSSKNLPSSLSSSLAPPISNMPPFFPMFPPSLFPSSLALPLQFPLPSFLPCSSLSSILHFLSINFRILDGMYRRNRDCLTVYVCWSLLPHFLNDLH